MAGDSFTDALALQLAAHEGLRLRPYRDTVGKLTIGFGRNLDDVGISKAEARHLLANDIAKVERELAASIPWWRDLSFNRQLVLADMAFNLGIAGLLKFKQTLGAVETGDYIGAAEGMLNSKWAQQVGGRAIRLARMMAEG